MYSGSHLIIVYIALYNCYISSLQLLYFVAFLYNCCNLYTIWYNCCTIWYNCCTIWYNCYTIWYNYYTILYNWGIFFNYTITSLTIQQDEILLLYFSIFFFSVDLWVFEVHLCDVWIIDFLHTFRKYKNNYVLSKAVHF